MQCGKCKSQIEDGSRFCNNCGAAANSDIECPACRTANSAGSRFCKSCGKNLLETVDTIADDNDELIEDVGSNTKVINGKTFFTELHKVYSAKIREKVKASYDAAYQSGAIDAFPAPALRRDVATSIDKSFKFLSDSVRDVITRDGREYILEKKGTFLADETIDLFSILDELEEKTALLRESYAKTEDGGTGMIKDAAISGAGSAGFVPGGTIIGGAYGAWKGKKDVDKEYNKQASLWSEWTVIRTKTHSEFNTLWLKLVELFVDDIFQNIPACLAEDESGELDELLELTNAMTVETPDKIMNIGVGYYNNQDYSQAVELFRKGAIQGHSDSQNWLGVCYANGHGVEQDYAKAVEWYRKVAEQGHNWGQYNLANCYYNGQGVERDLAKAVEWYRKSAEQGNSWAQQQLGICYRDATGVEQDYAKAYEWFKKSAELGYDGGQISLGRCYRDGQGVEQDYNKAYEWFNKAGVNGNKYGYFYIGNLYRDGLMTGRPSYTLADCYYRQSAEQGNAEAKECLEKLKSEGKVEAEQTVPEPVPIETMPPLFRRFW